MHRERSRYGLSGLFRHPQAIETAGASNVNQLRENICKKSKNIHFLVERTPTGVAALEIRFEALRAPRGRRASKRRALRNSARRNRETHANRL
jgi:hypothetical protein